MTDHKRSMILVQALPASKLDLRFGAMLVSAPNLTDNRGSCNPSLLPQPIAAHHANTHPNKHLHALGSTMVTTHTTTYDTKHVHKHVNTPVSHILVKKKAALQSWIYEEEEEEQQQQQQQQQQQPPSSSECGSLFFWVHTRQRTSRGSEARPSKMSPTGMVSSGALGSSWGLSVRRQHAP